MTNQKNIKTTFDDVAARAAAWDDLLQATVASDILNALARGLWIKEHGTEQPQRAIPTVGDFAGKRCIGTDSVTALFEYIGDSPGKQSHYLDFDENGKLVKAWKPTEVWKAPKGASGAYFLFMVCAAVQGLDGDSIEAAHTLWKDAKQDGYGGSHPLTDTVQAWLKDKDKKEMTEVDDRSFPVALRLPFGAVSAEEIEAEKDYHLPAFEPFDSQMMLNLGKPKSNELARHLPIRSWLADWNTPGAKPRGGRGGAVPLWLRLFLEALVCADRFQHKRVVFYEFEYLYKLMFGNVRWDIVRARRLRQMIDVASRAVVVLPDGGEVLPVNFKYFEGLEKDSKIFVEVAAVRDTRGGALTAIDDLRDAYRSSNATLQAYLSATEYLDRVWTRNNRLRYDTIPKTNADGVILDHLGQPMTTKTGSPLKSLKGAGKELLAQVKRIPNPEFTPRPVAVNQLMGACWTDKSIPNSQRRSYKKRALDAWDSLTIINLEEADEDNVIIRPSQEHRNTYKAIKKSGSKSKNDT